ncbi:phosphopantetheine-binding protein [Pseudonocardia sp. H11422]|uniref:phosphopantetheine-binding protein n=1 Tax=Pseudonocardia sp. H11422 TaxID=2835866 RepID=UPI001BDCD031|nr:phosphopantetheine-binding protein [Pseudonocardia sp. H11422]
MSVAREEVSLRIVVLMRDRLKVDVPDTDADLFDTGLLDSLALVMLIAALEESFACELPLDDFDIENFRTTRRITEFLDSSGLLEARGAW